jgi:hypothetical protein
MGQPCCPTPSTTRRGLLLPCPIRRYLSAYRILESGTLMPVPGSPFAIHGFGRPITVTVEPSGRFLHAANFGAANLSSYRITPNGAYRSRRELPDFGRHCSLKLFDIETLTVLFSWCPLDQQTRRARGREKRQLVPQKMRFVIARNYSTPPA